MGTISKSPHGGTGRLNTLDSKVPVVERNEPEQKTTTVIYLLIIVQGHDSEESRKVRFVLLLVSFVFYCEANFIRNAISLGEMECIPIIILLFGINIREVFEEVFRSFEVIR